MSVYYSVKVINGFKIKIKAIKIPKTQYNKDTGEPYKTMIFSHYIVICNNIEIASTKNDSDCSENVHFFDSGECIEGLEIFDTFSDECELIGIFLCDVCPNYIEKIIVKDSTALLNFAKKYKIKPQLYLASGPC